MPLLLDTATSAGAHGEYWPVLSQTQVTQLKSQSGLPGSIVVVLSGELFTPANIALLEAVKQVKGVLLLTNVIPQAPYSETSAFPQSTTSTGGESASYVWNMENHDLIHREYKWPVWSMPSGSELDTIRSLALSNSQTKTRYGAHMKQFMYGYQNAATCLRFKQCEPVGGHSVWGVLPAVNASLWSSTKFVVTLSRLDSLSLFANQATGAVADMSGLVANLAALTTLSGVDNIEGVVNPHGVDPKKFKNPILWSFFDAEHWGYAGSTRFVKDWTNFECITGPCTAAGFRDDFKKLRLDNLKSVFELRQVGAPQILDGSRKLFVHQDLHLTTPTPVAELVRQSGIGLTSNVSVARQHHGLPPSSSFTLLAAAERSNNPTFRGQIVVISDHETKYSNAYYGSRYDVAKNVDVQLVTDAATLLARSLYASAMEVSFSDAAKIKVNESLVRAWLDCATVNGNCSIARAYVPSLVSAPHMAPSHYHGPYFTWAVSYMSKLTHDYMTVMTRDRAQDSSLTSCPNGDECPSNAYCAVGKCINSSYVQYHDSYSTGIRPLAAGGWEITNSSLENWVEP